MTELKTKWLDVDCRPNWGGSKDPCARCGKEINRKKNKWLLVHLTNDGFYVIHPSEGDVDGSLGLHPIGPDCAKWLGLEWTIEPNRENEK